MINSDKIFNKKNGELRNYLLNLARLHYRFGLIGIDEYEERCRVAFWLADSDKDCLDPRGELDDMPDEVENNLPVEKNKSKEHDGLLHLKLLGIWVFTKADPDPYPSVPHGHYKNQNNKWPKLNPYTGRVFKQKHQEDTKKKLSRDQMRLIWNDESFKSFCREMIVWYLETHPNTFPVPDPFIFPRWRMR